MQTREPPGVPASLGATALDFVCTEPGLTGAQSSLPAPKQTGQTARLQGAGGGGGGEETALQVLLLIPPALDEVSKGSRSHGLLQGRR